MAAGRRAMGATPPVPEDSLPSLGVGRGPVPVYVTAKDDYLVLRTVRGGVAGAGQGGRSAQDPVLVVRSKDGVGVQCETLVYADAIKSGVVLGNELEREVHGLLGIITLLSGPYLVTIDASEVVGLAPNYCPLRRITRTSLQPVARRPQEALLAASPVLRVDESRYKAMVQRQASCGHLYLSHKYPLHQRIDVALHTTTLSPASPTPTSPTSPNPTGHEDLIASSQRFLWNAYLLQSLSQDEAIRGMWGACVISGYAASHSADFNGEAISITLISRRATTMQGTRFNRRGVDVEGEVSNCVETEVILHRPDGSRVSHVQVRGSLPLHWSQKVDLAYTPRVTLPDVPLEVQASSCGRHLSSLRRAYADSVLLVNLIDSCGKSRGSQDQKRLGDTLSTVLASMDGFAPLHANNGSMATSPTASPAPSTPASALPPPLSLLWFDFHKECKGLRWHRLSRLLSKIDRVLTAQGRTVLDPKCVAVESQQGVVRTNCMDNLDRTNVVQSIIARRVLLQALQSSNDSSRIHSTPTSLRRTSLENATSSPGPAVSPLPPYPDPSPARRSRTSSTGSGSSSSGNVLSSPHASFEEAFKDLWACNADALSVLYAGTPALKTDCVRTGQRTLRGALQDGVNSVCRYYINNFWDGTRQDAVSLFLGLYRPDAQAVSPFPPYPLPTLPGGVIFTWSYALQGLCPHGLTRQVGHVVVSVVLAGVQALFDLSDDSWLLWLVGLYLLLPLAFFAFWEALLCLGPFGLLTKVRKNRQAFTDRPMLGVDKEVVGPKEGRGEGKQREAKSNGARPHED